MFLSHIKSCILTWSELLPSLQKHWELQLFTISICNANSKKAEFPSVGFDNKQPSKSYTSHPSEPELPGYNKLQKGWDTDWFFMYIEQTIPLSESYCSQPPEQSWICHCQAPYCSCTALNEGNGMVQEENARWTGKDKL